VFVVLEVPLNRVCGIGEEVGVFLFAGRQPEVDQVGGGVVADRVPVLAPPVAPQALGACVQADGVDVREVAALFAIEEVVVKQLDG